MDNKEAISIPSTIETVPRITRTICCGGIKEERRVTGRESHLKNWTFKCFSVKESAREDGMLSNVSCSLPPPPISLTRKVAAEFVGTAILIFVAVGTSIVNQKTQGSITFLGLATSSGLIVMVVVLSIGHISGAHLNPAVTISFAAVKHFPWKQVHMYIIAQIMASLCAALALKVVFHPLKDTDQGVTVPSSGGCGQAFVLEFIISFILMFVVTAVATDTRAVGELAAIGVGATVMVNVLIAGEISGASMNPARTLGPAIVANNYKAIWIYVAAPILGTLCGAGTYTFVKLP